MNTPDLCTIYFFLCLPLYKKLKLTFEFRTCDINLAVPACAAVLPPLQTVVADEVDCEQDGTRNRVTDGQVACTRVQARPTATPFQVRARTSFESFESDDTGGRVNTDGDAWQSWRRMAQLASGR